MAFVIGNANKMLLLLLLFEIKALIDRIVGAWKLKLGKNITRHYLPKGLTMLFLVTVIAILRFFGKIRKRICDPRSYGFFDTKETQNPKKDYFVMTRQAGGTQYICQNDISLVLPKNSTRMEYK